MADARALLRAKRQEARITHPYAAYSGTGQLRCTACGAAVKQASMWEGHLGSKAHRVAVAKAREAAEARERDEQEKEEREEARRRGKRKAGDGVEDGEEDGMDVDSDVDTKRRRMGGVDTGPSAAKAAAKPQTASKNGFPADFFSDPSQAPVLSTDDDVDAEADDAPPPAPPKEKSQLDLEWEQFQAAILKNDAANEERDEDRRSAFARATVFAEPELAPSGAEGFPASVSGAVPTAGEQAAEEVGVEGPPKEETEEERRRRKEQEERELIMDRLVEEERVQEEADERVGLLKARVEALKKAREAKRAGKKAGPTK